MTGVGAALLLASGVAAARVGAPLGTTETTTTTSTPTSTATNTTTVSSSTTSTVSTTASTSTTTVATPSTTTTSPQTHATTSSLPSGLQRGTVPQSKTAGPRGHVAPQHKKRKRKSKPLKVTPPLGQRSFVFPVVGPAGYGDSYGQVRSDVNGGWHHGDDIFAPLGAPVVAVASGTINRVGWEKVGGWRLWVRDGAADEFYYAHLSGYTRSVFHSKSVQAGQVLGFVGNTGDAYGGAPHLHFEIHPRQLLRLGYGGAVDPTTYLDSWSHLEDVDAPYPVRPRLPKSPLLRNEARRVFRELLAARHLLEPPKATPHDPVPESVSSSVLERLPTRAARSAISARGEGASLSFPLLAGVVALAVLVGIVSLVVLATTGLQVALRRTRRPAPARPAAEAAED